MSICNLLRKQWWLLSIRLLFLLLGRYFADCCSLFGGCFVLSPSAFDVYERNRSAVTLEPLI
jgi:hypothetical protein